MDHLILSSVIAALVGYFLGSCPNGLLICNALGVDIRHEGSGNIGATNVLRVVGKKWGYLVFALDALKGLVAVRLAVAIAQWLSPDARHLEIVGIVAGVACVVGHSFPVWLRFHGGKGVATSAGVMLGLMPIAVVSVTAVWFILFQVTKYVSVASIGAAIALPILVSIYLHYSILHGSSLLLFSILIAAVVLWRHRSNMQRLWQGEEERFKEK